ncbi:MAG: phage tail sheath protein [Spirochaetaceae bacterium]|jgi:phage tail sheath gpL-like|nr:phage tail sheath protein [Spirochaetaceae bacterium]
MAIPFTQIPANLLVPGQYGEIDNSLAGSVGDIKKALIIAYKTGAGSAPAGSVKRVVSEDKAAEWFGAGSPASRLAAAFLSINKTEELWVLPVAEPEAGETWEKEFSVAVSAEAKGAVSITINGNAIPAAAINLTGIEADARPEAAAAAIVARINSNPSLPVEAEALADGLFVVRSVVKGDVGNDNSVQFVSSTEELTITAEGHTPGEETADIAPLLQSLGAVRYNYIVSDFADADNITALAAELDSRYSAMRQIGGRAFIALSGIAGSESELRSVIWKAEAVNNPHIILIPRLQNPELPGEWAARFCAASCRILADDPSANTYDTQVVGLTSQNEIDFETRQRLLEAGVVTWRCDTTGNVLVERLVTSYTENTDGGRDTSYLDIQVVETIDAIRTHINDTAKKRFKTWKLSSTDENFGSGAKVMSPAIWRSFLSELYSEVFLKEKCWCQDFDGYKKSINVEIKAGSKTRLEYSHTPNLIGQFYIGAGLHQFK